VFSLSAWIALALSYIGDRVAVLESLNKVWSLTEKWNIKNSQHHCGNKRVRRLGFNYKLSKVDQIWWDRKLHRKKARM
jgi:hypothetical protein